MEMLPSSGGSIEIPENLGVVDAHCHASEFWYEPVEPLLFQMDRHGIERAVIVQVLGQYDNSYQRKCVQAHPDRLCSVVSVDVNREDSCEELERLALEEGATGLFTHSIERSPGDDPLAIWRTAERLKLPVIVPLSRGKGGDSQKERNEFAELIAELPRLPIVLAHLGGAKPPFGEDETSLRAQAFSLSRFPNVYITFGGVGEIAERAFPLGPGHYYGPFPPYHMMAYEAFGAERLMWGSNYPRVSGHEGYAGALASAKERFAGLPENEQGLIFGGNANRLYFSRAA